MYKKKIKSTIIASLLMAGTAFAFTSCDTGTSPGETNVERSDIKEEGSMIESDEKEMSEQDKLEKHYDHADHENHDDNDAEVIGDGAYDGKDNKSERKR